MRQTMALVGLAGNVGGYALGKVFKPKCFVAGTQVLAMVGAGAAAPVGIEEVRVGDLVWARCDVTGHEGFKPVVTLFRNVTDSLVHVTYTTSGAGAPPACGGGSLPARFGGYADATHTLTGTAEHPFWSVTRGAWVEMGALQSHETLLLAGGHTATITSVRTERLATPVAVHNFEVADWHTYHVGTPTGWVWVHNTCKVSAKTGNLLELRPSKGGTGPNRWQRVIADGESLSQARPKMAQVGNAGTSPGIRELAGTGSDARRVYDAMTKGGTVKPHPSGLTITRMPDGTFATFRAAGKVPNATTGVAPPTIDINVPGQPLLKWKMLP